MKFTKMQGLGNDYVYVDCFHEPFPEDPASLAVAVSDRHFGIGGDGLILICPADADGNDARMRMYNADGSESEMCGNGIRCVAKYLYDHGICQTSPLKIETGAGVLTLELMIENVKVDRVRVDMGPAILNPASVPTTLRADAGEDEPIVDQVITVDGHSFPVTCVSMGNPHCVIFVDEATDDLVTRFGPLIETDARFPRRINVEFVEVISPTEVRQRTWERGSGETLACGTGASAVCVAGVLTGRTSRAITNHLLGGVLLLEWDEASGHVFMTGPATEVFSGSWDEPAEALSR